MTDAEIMAAAILEAAGLSLSRYAPEERRAIVDVARRRHYEIFVCGYRDAYYAGYNDGYEDGTGTEG